VSLYASLNSLDDLQKLIDSQERESDSLEYKTASERLKPSDKDEAAKDISAFANASGGLLIYGISTYADDPTRPDKLAPIDPWNVDYIRRNALDAIRHPIPGIETKTLPVGTTPEALLINVPASPLAPHQVVTHYRYYRRQGADSSPMTHDLVELFFGRRMQAVLEPSIQCKTERVADPDVTLRVTFGLLNVGGEIGRDVLMRIVLEPNRATVRQHDCWMEVEQAAGGRMHSESSRGARVMSLQHRSDELFYPGVPKPSMTCILTTHKQTIGPEKPVIFLDVYAAGSRPRRYMLYVSLVTEGEYSLEWKETSELPPIFP
jgi:hypothetical protein